MKEIPEETKIKLFKMFEELVSKTLTFVMDEKDNLDVDIAAGVALSACASIIYIMHKDQPDVQQLMINNCLKKGRFIAEDTIASYGEK